MDTGKLRSLALGPRSWRRQRGEPVSLVLEPAVLRPVRQAMERARLSGRWSAPHVPNTVYPKICPAVIVAIHDGDRLVLTRYKDRPFKHYALVAGFNEIGESIEETVHREVFEETGLRVKNLRFYKSQPWTFTDTLLFGFFAEA